jgi:hypothetical protein
VARTAQRPGVEPVSVRVMTAVFDHSRARLADRLVLLVIADRSGDDGGGCWRGKESIARMAGISRSQVTNSIRRLRELGELETTERPGRTNEYRIVLPLPGQILADSAPQPGQNLADTLEGSGLPVGYTGSRDTSLDPSREPSTLALRPLVDVGSQSLAVKRVFAAWQESTGKPRARLDAKRRALIERRLGEYGEEYLLAAVRGWEQIPYNRGENDRRRPYNELGLLLRDAEHTERFHDAAVAPPPSKYVSRGWPNP